MHRLIVCAGLLALAGFAELEGQTGQGSITGTISDPSGAAVASATVLLNNQSTGLELKQTAQGNGDYHFALVPPGMYSLSIKAAGFGEKIVKEIRVDPSQTVPLNVTLSRKLSGVARASPSRSYVPESLRWPALSGCEP